MQLHPRKSFLLATSLTILVELYLFPRTAFSLNCSALPLVVPVTNTTLSTGFQKRGLPISIGTPAQNFSLNAYMNFNNTVFEEGPITNDNCNKTTNSVDRCIIVKGGLYDRESSSSWSGHMTREEFRGALDVLQVIDIMGEETMHLPGLELMNVPIDIGDSQTSGMGLGINSSLLNSLVASGGIPSRVWGLDWGWTGATNDTWKDGSLVLGGYDKSRIKDNKLFAQDFLDTSGCALTVFIIQISMANDTNEVQLIDSNNPLRACVTPDYNLITLPYDTFTKFNEAMGDVYVNRTLGDFYTWGFESDVENGYKGSMTITLSNGFSTTIPNHELIQPYRDYNFDGKPVITNSQKNVLVLNSLQGVNEHDLPLLGLPFLSAAYLVVDSDQRQFHLGESVASSGEALISGAHPQCPQNSQTPGSSSGTSHAPTGSSPSQSRVWVGVAVAVSAVVLAVVAIAVFRYKKSKKSNPVDVQAIIKSPIEESVKSTAYELSSHGIYEADSNSIQPVVNRRM